ncbi:MAG: CvpA family protein [Pseudomonadota bacterium]
MDLNSSELSWIVDVLVGLLVLISAYLAMVRGIIREIFALASWAIAFVAAFLLAPSLHPALAELPAVGVYMENCQVAMLVAFVIIFGLALIASGLIIWIFTGSGRNSALSIFDQGMGFIYGGIRGLALVAVVYIAYELVVGPDTSYAFVDNAATIGIVQATADVLRGFVPDQMPAFLDAQINQLMGECGEVGAE